MPTKKITKEDLNFLKEHAKNPIWSLKDINKGFELLNDPKNATEIIKEVSSADIMLLVGWLNTPIYDTWSTQQKIALVKKDISFFAKFTNSSFNRSRRLDDQELLKECLKEFNKKFSPDQRKNEYYSNFRTSLGFITFNQENLETFIKSFPEPSPFIFEEYPFKEIKNWRELIRSNPNLALQNRMLEAMDEVNYFSKGDLQKFKEKYDDLLKNKTFYNHFVERANSEIKTKIISEEVEAKDAIYLADSYGEHDKADKIEEESNKKIEKYVASLNYITETFGPYKRYIMEQELAKQQKAGSGVTA